MSRMVGVFLDLLFAVYQVLTLPVARFQGMIDMVLMARFQAMIDMVLMARFQAMIDMVLMARFQAMIDMTLWQSSKL